MRCSPKPKAGAKGKADKCGKMATPTPAPQRPLVTIASGSATRIVPATVASAPSAPVTRMTKLRLPVDVGVPEITPVAASSESPVGSPPEARLQAYGDVPPAAARVVA